MSFKTSSWQESPTKTEVHLAYLEPQTPKHWQNISNLILSGGFGVEPNPYNNVHATERSTLPDFQVTWPTEQQKNEDYRSFFAACEMIIGTLDLEDVDFAHSTLPDVFSVLKDSYLFQHLYSKVSQSQNNTVQHHIETVPTLVRTSATNLKERFVLRTVAVFHDIGKAFNIGRDQVHYHALIASNIVSWFMETYKERFVNHLILFDKKSQEKVISVAENGNTLFSQEEIEAEFNRLKDQITEIIRLHHVLEQIAKGVLDLNTVAEIFVGSEINPLSYAQFIIADGSSVIPDNEKYAQFLLENIDALIRLVDVLYFEKLLDDPQTSDEVKLGIVQSLQAVISIVAEGEFENNPGMLAKVQEIAKKLEDQIHSLLVQSLLGLESTSDYGMMG